MTLKDLLDIKFNYPDYAYQILLQDDGQGPYIKEWNLPNVSQPTQEDLEQWSIELAPQFQLNKNKINNQPIYDQLEAIDMKSIRALRTNDTVRLAALEQEAVALRSQLLPTQ